eukprot:g8554.t1
MGTLIGRHKLSFGDPLHSKNLSLCDLQEFHHQEPQAIDGHHETWTVHHVWEDGSQEGDDEGTWSESDEGGEVEGDDSMDLGSDGIGDDFQEVERPDTGGFEFDSTPYDDRVMASQACFHTGRSFSLLDAPEHTPSSVKDRTACKAQCAKVHTAAHFVFHEPTKLCHCPPKGVIKTEAILPKRSCVVPVSILPRCRLINDYSTWESGDIGYAQVAPAGRYEPSQVFAAACQEIAVGITACILYVGGPVLSYGYYGHSDITAAKFSDGVNSEMVALSQGKWKWYKTGQDLPVQPPVLEIRGRIDSTVKIRGFKVGLPVVEGAIAQISGVALCAVVPVYETPTSVDSLLCFVKPQDEVLYEDLIQRIKKEAVKEIPRWMMPSYFRPLPSDCFMGGESRKLNRRRLAEMADLKTLKEAQQAAQPILPRQPSLLEETGVRGVVKSVWAKVLSLEFVLRPKTPLLDEVVGVFAAAGIDGYLVHHLDGQSLKDTLNPQDIFLTEIGNEKEPASLGRVWRLGCAWFSATQVQKGGKHDELLNWSEDAAVAGASSITFPNLGYLYADGLVSSMDGYVRPFDAGADGTVFGDSVAALVLKKQEDVGDNNLAYAALKGYAISNDGAQKAGYAAPSSNGQSRAVQTAMRMLNEECGSCWLCYWYLDIQCRETFLALQLNEAFVT